MLKGTFQLRPDIMEELRMSALRDQTSPQLAVVAEHAQLSAAPFSY